MLMMKLSAKPQHANYLLQWLTSAKIRQALILLVPPATSNFVSKPTGGYMPIYDYHCNNCDKAFELLVRSSTVLACPHCGSVQLEKLVSMPASKSKIDVIRKRARSQGAREGHFSNYKPSEIPR